jgi:hypothetical protein
MTQEAEMRGDIRAKLLEIADKIDGKPPTEEMKREVMQLAIDIFAGTLGDVASIAISLRTIAAINAKNEEGPLLDVPPR